MARMVAAGVPDMQLAPNSNAPSLTGRTSNTSVAGARAATAPLVDMSAEVACRVVTPCIQQMRV